MADDDYAPVAVADEEDERDPLKRGYNPLTSAGADNIPVAPPITSGATTGYAAPVVPYAPPNSQPPVRPAPQTFDDLQPPQMASMPAVNAGTALPPAPSGPNLNEDIGAGRVAPPSASDYKPVQPSFKKQLLNRIAAGMVAYKDPQAGLAMRMRQEQQPQVEATNAMNRDIGTYNKGLETNKDESEQGLQKAQADEAEARAATLKNPSAKEGLTPEETTIHDLMTGDNGKPRINPETKQPYSYLEAFKAVQKPVAPNQTEQAVSDQLAADKLPDTPENRARVRKDMKEKPQQPQRELIAEPQPDGSTKLVEATPGMTLPKGATPASGIGKGDQKADEAEAAGKAAQQYADDYMAGKQFTGPGDEALMEKYFELAKPSSGFRMTQSQIELLMKARDMMDSVVAKGKHLFTPDAPYFSTTQREHIVDTMKNLQTARDEVKAGGGKGPITEDEAKDYLKRAGGDKDKARALAKADNRTF